MSMKLIQNSGIPIYQQIADAFRSDILSGKMLQEQHMRRIEDSLTDAIKAARMAGISRDEVMKTFDLLWNMQE